jgi:hypothetical protein
MINIEAPVFLAGDEMFERENHNSLQGDVAPAPYATRLFGLYKASRVPGVGLENWAETNTNQAPLPVQQPRRVSEMDNHPVLLVAPFMWNVIMCVRFRQSLIH